ncbi:MAG: VWA domain-containing protein [Candidatus Thiodiazotropha sp. (ex. Lucinisca nassula)]|nr:VWA domain-containing protein [Candidatus Thiodiazotropha sp. (ex. Lucinisca nassula)]
MEERVGELWHRLITRAAQSRYPEAAVTLQQVSTSTGILFRALGGDGGLQVEAAHATEHSARRSLLHRIAGDNKKIELAWRDEQSLRLPAVIDFFSTPQLNKDLYRWLVVLSVGEPQQDEPWFSRNQRLTCRVLELYPSMRLLYQRLVSAHLAQRLQPPSHQSAEMAQESAIRQALLEPGSIRVLPQAPRPPQPVPLWLHPCPPVSISRQQNRNNPESSGGGSKALESETKRLAEETDKKEAKGRGLVTIRMENIFTWGGFLKLDRDAEENEDLESAADAAEDLDLITISRDARGSAGKLRFDLDLPAAVEDDLVLHDGILLPEWDFKKRRLIPDLCRVVPMLAADAGSSILPPHLYRTAKKLRAQFQYLAPSRKWYKGQQDGSEIDLDAYLRFATDRIAGHASTDNGLYRQLKVGSRDLACLLLADLSLSTDTWVGNHARVIDVIRDSLFLFSESLSATGDAFAIYGFSSRKRDPVRFHQIKRFDEQYNGAVRGRIQAIKPGYYTRMGAAIRHSTSILKQQPSERRLLMILSDGKPNDLDKYEGRYGIEDTREAVREARAEGLEPFCVTIDSKANDYLPHLFGSTGYVVIRKPSELPSELPRLYAKLTS